MLLPDDAHRLLPLGSVAELVVAVRDERCELTGGAVRPDHAWEHLLDAHHAVADHAGARRDGVEDAVRHEPARRHVGPAVVEHHPGVGVRPGQVDIGKVVGRDQVGRDEPLPSRAADHHRQLGRNRVAHDRPEPMTAGAAHEQHLGPEGDRRPGPKAPRVCGLQQRAHLPAAVLRHPKAPQWPRCESQVVRGDLGWTHLVRVTDDPQHATRTRRCGDRREPAKDEHHIVEVGRRAVVSLCPVDDHVLTEPPQGSGEVVRESAVAPDVPAPAERRRGLDRPSQRWTTDPGPGGDR